MKKILLSLIFINLFIVCKGQKSKIEYGLHAGMNIATAYGDGISKEYRRPLTGFNIGGHLKVSKNENWGLRLLLSYDKIGWTYKSIVLENNQATGLVNADIEFELDYLNLPVLAEYSFGTKVKMNADAGVFFGVLLNNKIITKLNQPIPPNQEAVTETKSSYRKSTNFGLSFGLGIQIPIAPKIKLDFDIRNYTGLSNIYKSNTNDVTEIKTLTNAISIGFSYRM